MRRSYRLRRVSLAAAFLLSTSGAAAQSLAPAAAPEAARNGRIADLVRLWYFTRLFHPALADPSAGWDGALIAAVPDALAATDDTAFAAVADTMLAKAGDSSAFPRQGSPAEAPPPAEPAATPAAFRIENGAVIGSCVGIAQLGGAAAVNAALRPVAPAVAELGLVIDCRRFPADGSRYRLGQAAASWILNFASWQISAPKPGGSMRMRYHEGYPPEHGSSSGGYTNGTVSTQLPALLPSPGVQGPGAPRRVVLIVDSTTPDSSPLAGALQAAGVARAVADGPLFEGRYPLMLDHVGASIHTSDYVYPDGRIGFRPNACTAPGSGDDAMRAALAMLDPAASGPPCRPPSAPAAVASVPPPADGGGNPSVGERVLALAKFWGAIEYFYPYKALLDRPWDGQLERFVPQFLGAGTRAAYEEAAVRLAHEIQDTHVGVIGQRETAQVRRRWAPPLYVRPVGSGFEVVGFHDDSAKDRVRLADEIVAVDGRPVEAVAADIAAIISSSTPQSLAGYEASALLAGPEGSEARLTLRRAGKPVEVSVKRSLPAYKAGARPDDASTPWRRLAPDIGYVDLARLPYADADKAIDALIDTRAIVFDLRGYPQGTAWAIAPRLARPGREGAVAASFRRPHYLGPGAADEGFTAFEQKLPLTDKPRYAGKVIVLIDDRAISQSEHTALFFKAAADARFVGTPTTGANGDVTTIALPGGLWVGFTGHDVRHPDGTRLQRVGIQPDVRVAPTLKGIRSGRDEILEAGLRLALQK